MDPKDACEKIRAFFDEKKRMPTYREIRDQVLRTRSMKQTRALVDALLQSGFLKQDRAGHLLPTDFFGSVKKLGYVEAGWPSPAEEEVLDTLTLDQWLIKNKEATYLLEVKGQSMLNAGIRPGDVALVERGRTPRDGDIVIAQVDSKWTMKYYRLEGKKVALVPANSKFKTIYPQEELRIEAVVTAIIRKY